MFFFLIVCVIKVIATREANTDAKPFFNFQSVPFITGFTLHMNGKRANINWGFETSVCLFC